MKVKHLWAPGFLYRSYYESGNRSWLKTRMQSAEANLQLNLNCIFISSLVLSKRSPPALYSGCREGKIDHSVLLKISVQKELLMTKKQWATFCSPRQTLCSLDSCHPWLRSGLDHRLSFSLARKSARQNKEDEWGQS